MLAIGTGLTLSMAAMFTTVSGTMMIVLCLLWAFTAGLSGARLRSRWWVAGSRGAMLGPVMLWEVTNGHQSWQSLYVFMLGCNRPSRATLGMQRPGHARRLAPRSSKGDCSYQVHVANVRALANVAWLICQWRSLPVRFLADDGCHARRP